VFQQLPSSFDQMHEGNRRQNVGVQIGVANTGEEFGLLASAQSGLWTK